jgi:hypothetical protein
MTMMGFKFQLKPRTEEFLTICRITTYIYICVCVCVCVSYRTANAVLFYIFIQQIYVLNILNVLHNLRFLLFKCRLFHNATLFGS